MITFLSIAIGVTLIGIIVFIYSKNPWKETYTSFFKGRYNVDTTATLVVPVKQKHEFSCGPSSVEMLFRSFNIDVDSEAIHSYFSSGFTSSGTTP